MRSPDHLPRLPVTRAREEDFYRRPPYKVPPEGYPLQTSAAERRPLVRLRSKTVGSASAKPLRSFRRSTGRRQPQARSSERLPGVVPNVAGDDCLVFTFGPGHVGAACGVELAADPVVGNPVVVTGALLAAVEGSGAAAR